MTERPFSTTPAVAAAAAAIMVVMVATLLLGGVVASVAAWLALGAAVLIDFPSDPGASS